MGTKDEKETLKQAAAAAAGLIAKKEQERAKLDADLARLRAVVDAWEAVYGRKPKKAPGLKVDVADSVDVTEHVAVRRGQVREHVDAILTSGGDYTEPEVRKQIAERFNVQYGRPSVYTALRRGRKEGRYEVKESRWRMKSA